MKVYTQIGSKERFLEMFEGVNKQKLNEAVTSGEQLVEKAFNQLKNKEIDIKQTNTQTEGDKNFVEIITSNGDAEIIYRFELSSDETVQDDVYNVNNAKLSELKIKSPTTNVELPENMKAIQDFNQKYGNEILTVVAEYANFDTDSIEDDELYEEAIKLIDKVPYKKGTEEIQTNVAYGDQKPTNPDLRVDSPELDQFVSEIDDYVKDTENDDMFSLPPEPEVNNEPIKNKNIDPYEKEVEFDDENVDSQADEEIYTLAYDNLVNSGISAPTIGQIEAEVLKLKRESGEAEPFEKERIIPQGAEKFYEGKDNVVTDMGGDVVGQTFEKNLTPDEKKKFILMADTSLKNQLGDRLLRLPKEQYIRMVKNVAVDLYQMNLSGVPDVTSGMNEDEKNSYPDQMGKKFKPKGQFPKKKKKPQSVVNLGEEEAVDIDKMMDDKEETGDVVVGGLADEKKPSDFDKEQLALGLKVEMEHTDNPMVALEIAMDHLTEDPEYYSHKDDPEASAQIGAANDAEGDDDLTDELLGYKPLNIGDVEQVSEDMDEYQGDMGDRYEDAEGNQFTVKGKVNGGVTLQGQGGQKEIATSDIQYLKPLSENVDGKKKMINEEEIKTARQVLKNRSDMMTKKEAVQLLILNNIK